MNPQYLTPRLHSRHAPRPPLPTFTSILIGACLASCAWLAFIYYELHCS